MKLSRLELQDYQGIRSFVMETGGSDCTVYGTNGTGKTTIANAISWLLYDKPYTGEKGYSPKTIDAEGHELHHLDHKVVGTFIREDGGKITLAKVYHETWKKKRGSSTEEFSGHVTDTYIDGVPVSAGEYKRTLEAICSPDRAKVLTDPRYFSKSLHWEDRRKILLEMCGDITDAEIIEGNNDLDGLWEFLRKPGTTDQYYTVEEFGRISASRKAELNRELTIIPARIDEAKKSIPDTEGLPPEKSLDGMIERLEAKKADLIARSAAVTEDDRLQTLRRQRGELDTEIAEARASYTQAVAMRNGSVNEVINEISRELTSTIADITIMRQKAESIEGEIKRLEAARAELLSKHAEVKARVWQGDTICAACGQPLPEDRIQQARDRFNQKRSHDLAEINAEGQKCSKTIIEERKDQLEEVQADLEQAMMRQKSQEEELEKAKSQVEPMPKFEETDEYAALAARRAEVTAAIQAQEAGEAEEKTSVQAEVDDLTDRIRAAQEARIQYVTARKRTERMEELEQQEKDIAAEYERFERGTYLCEVFTRAKVAMLDERINQRFSAVRFRLFRQQINGGLQDCCDVLCPTSSGLTPYDSANNAAQINAGIEIASALGRYWRQTMPIIIDNAESVVDLIDTDAQVIRLVVSEQDERLRVAADGDTIEQDGVA